jgi:hypothetical protein
VWRDKIVFHNLNQPRPGRSYEGGQRPRRVSLVLSNDLKEKLDVPILGTHAGCSRLQLYHHWRA